VTLIPNGIHHPPIEDGRLLPNSVKKLEGTARSSLRTALLTSGQDSRGWWIRMVDKFIGLASRKQPGVINVEVLTRGWSDLFSDNHKFINSN
ncbi:hypothetical protein, partial [Enterococcus faecium]